MAMGEVTQSSPKSFSDLCSIIDMGMAIVDRNNETPSNAALAMNIILPKMLESFKLISRPDMTKQYRNRKKPRI